MKTLNGRLWKTLGIFALIGALALALTGCSSSTDSGASSASADSSGVVESSVDASSSAASEDTGFNINITAPEWDALTSTPFVLALQPVVEGAVDTAPTYVAVAANETNLVPVDAGMYRVTLISAVNMDGSIYLVPTTKEVIAGKISGNVETLNLTPAQVASEAVTPDQMEHVIAALTVASESLEGSSGSKVLEDAISNAQYAGEVPEETIQAGEALGRDALEKGTSSDVTLNIPPQNLMTE